MDLSLPTTKGFTCLTAIIAVVIGKALHYATECICTVSWHMRKPAPNFEQEWLKGSPITSSPGRKLVGLTNSLVKTKIFSGLPSVQLPSELN
ncbi:hypothetical protein AVEN_209130-1 [Araneus ventricosus]|uniref:Uncharacterized protein n=1 Tax=Araneus ventricosus TaxID=182803 RepID=A0A4Y2A1T7_ARAVE|nr:hypothetical protein AVEN_209130-1 [Araneus ventricosus]